MKFAWQILIHTPLWAWALLAFLIWQGIKGMRPRKVTIWRSPIRVGRRWRTSAPLTGVAG